MVTGSVTLQYEAYSYQDKCSSAQAAESALAMVRCGSELVVQ
jgi:hypothetical protein